jgi:hypothetical protein
MRRSVLEKIGAEPGTRCVVMGMSADQVAALGWSPGHAARSLEGEYDYIHAFVTSSAELETTLTKAKPHLRSSGMLWISWPKAGALGTDLNLKSIIATGYRRGLVESKTIDVNATWSAIKFTFPVPGKRYRNRYGRLRRSAA